MLNLSTLHKTTLNKGVLGSDGLGEKKKEEEEDGKNASLKPIGVCFHFPSHQYVWNPDPKCFCVIETPKPSTITTPSTSSTLKAILLPQMPVFYVDTEGFILINILNHHDDTFCVHGQHPSSYK